MSKRKIKNKSIKPFIPALTILAVLAIATIVFFIYRNNSKDSTMATNQSVTNNKTESSQSSSQAGNKQIDYLKKLQTEGFSASEIDSSKFYVERFTSLLKQILLFGNDSAAPVVPDPLQEPGEDLQVYSELSSKLEEEKAVYLMLKLKKDFNTIEKVFDEYLLCLQIDIDLEGYLKNKEQFLKEKDEKVQGRGLKDFLNYETVEKKALDMLQKHNNKSNSQDPGTKNNPNGTNLSPGSIVPDNQPNIPKVEVPKPIDPTKELQEKLNPQPNF